MKLLFISDFISEGHSGGAHLSLAHLNSLIDLFGKENIICISLTYQKEILPSGNIDYCFSSYSSNVQQLRNVIQGNTHVLNNEIIKKVLGIISKEKIDVCFFDNGYFGKLCKAVKKKYPSINIISFNHGILRNPTNQQIGERKTKIKYWPQVFGLLRGERQSSKFSDVNIVINDRDALVFEKHYHKKPELILPVYIENSGAAVLRDESVSHTAKILFVGGNFYPNVYGIRWFVREVLPKLNCQFELNIVGRGLEFLKDEFKDSQYVNVIGGVEDLSFWYNEANIVIGPIFHGDGMKTKTAEALMFGKTYIGTKEAICGYSELNSFECDTIDQFVDLIDKMAIEGIKKYDNNMERIFIDNYSTDSANKKFKELFDLLIKKNNRR